METTILFLDKIHNTTLKEKAKNLSIILQSFPTPFYIACSGGLDSRFLAFFSQKLGLNFTLLHCIGNHTDPKESAYLQTWVEKNSLSLKILPINIFTIQEIQFNHKDRCYHCKKIIFQTMLENIHHAPLCDGSHADDKNSYRPGLKALQELKILSPLAMANFSKSDIRQLALYIGLENPMQKAKPCLLTRFPYYTKIELDKINQITIYENICEEFFTHHISSSFDFRIRNIDNKLSLHYTTCIENSILEKLQLTLKQAQLEPLTIKQLSKLSGYFDNEF